MDARGRLDTQDLFYPRSLLLRCPSRFINVSHPSSYLPGKATKLAHPDPSQGGSSPRIPGESEDDIELRRAEQAARDGPSKKGKGKRTEADDEDFSWE